MSLESSKTLKRKEMRRRNKKKKLDAYKEMRRKLLSQERDVKVNKLIALLQPRCKTTQTPPERPSSCAQCKLLKKKLKMKSKKRKFLELFFRKNRKRNADSSSDDSSSEESTH